MRLYPAPPMPQEIVERMRSLKESGMDRERLIGEMRGAGLHIVECMKLMREFYGMDHGEAKRIVHCSDAWTDVREPAERLHESLIQAAKDEGWTVTEEPEQQEHAPPTAA